MEENLFQVYFKFINLNPSKTNILEYKENNQIIKYEIKEIEYNVSIKKKEFEFKIIVNEKEKNYKVELSMNYYNEIAIDLNNDKNGYNIEFIIKNVQGEYFKKLSILSGGIKYNFLSVYNDLNLCRIYLLNIPLGFKIFLNKEENQFENFAELINQEGIKLANEGKEEKSKKEIKFINNKRKRTELNEESEILTNEIINKNSSNENEEEFEESDDNNDNKVSDNLFNNNINNDCDNEIKYELENYDIKNLLFCIKDDYQITLTIHNMYEDYKLEEKISQNINKVSLTYYIEEGLKDINILKNILVSQSFNNLKNETNVILNKYSKAYYDSTDLSLLEDNNFTEVHYLLSIKSFFTHLIIEICELIIGMLNFYFKHIKSFSNSTEKEKTVKDILDKILNKYELFICYFNYFDSMNIKKENIENLKLFKTDLSLKEKSYYLSCILTVILMSPKNDKSNYIEFFEIKDNTDDIYSKVKTFIFNIIDKLNNKSAYLNGLELTTSRIKKDLNKNNYYNYKKDNTKRIFTLEMRTISDLKKTIKNFFPKIMVRTFNSQSGFNAHIDNFSGLMIINENCYERNSIEKLKGNYDDSKAFKSQDKIIKGLIDLKNENNNELYNLFIYKAFWRINHECFGHLPVLEINNKKCDTPKKFISKGAFIKSNDAGKILEYFFNINEDEVDRIKNINCDVISLLEGELFAGKDFNLLWKKFSELEDKISSEESYEINSEDNFLYELLSEYDKIMNLKGERKEIIRQKQIQKIFNLKKRFKC